MKVRGQVFSLVELLIVMAIIAVLTALLLPALRKAKDAAGGIQCLNSEKQLLAAEAMYSNDHNGFLTAYYAGNHAGKSFYWWTFLVDGDYLGGRDLNSENKGMTCSINPVKRTYSKWINYAINERVGQTYDFSRSDLLRNISSVSKPGDAIIFFDSAVLTFDTNSVGYTRNANKMGVNLCPGNVDYFLCEACLIHNRKLNGVFLDGHAEPLDRGKLQQKANSLWKLDD